MTKYILLYFSILLSSGSFGQDPIKLAKLKYDGGGDWYANKTALPNLASFCNRYLRMDFDKVDEVVEVGSPDIFLYPYIYLTGHGNVVFNSRQAENLRKYMIAGGFLHIDDDYGMDRIAFQSSDL